MRGEALWRRGRRVLQLLRGPQAAGRRGIGDGAKGWGGHDRAVRHSPPGPA